MDTIYWHMNATQGGANLLTCANCTRVQIAHMNTALVSEPLRDKTSDCGFKSNEDSDAQSDQCPHCLHREI